MTRANKYIFISSILFSIIYILRTGLVYSFPNDQLWTHYNLWLQDLTFHEDLFYYSESWKKSLWYFLLLEIKDLIKIDKLLVYYSIQLTNIFLFFFLLFRIFDHFNPKTNYIKYIYFGLLISSTNFWLSGSLSNFHEIGFNYRSTPFILGIISFYFLLKNKINFSLILLTIASLMHLPVVVPFYLIMTLYFSKFKKVNFYFLASSILITLIFIFSNMEISYSNNNLEILKQLIKLRQSYIFIENWSIDSLIRYFGFYLLIFSFYYYTKNIKFKKIILLLIFIHLFYMICVMLTNHLPTFSVFRFGRELFVMIILSFIIFLNLDFKKKFFNLTFYTAIFSQFIFGSFSIFLALFMFLYFFQSKFIKEKIASNIYESIYRNY